MNYNYIFICLIILFKQYKKQIFVSLVILLGISLSFASNNQLKTKNPNKAFSKSFASNKLPKQTFNKDSGKTQKFHKNKSIPDKYIISGLPGNVLTDKIIPEYPGKYLNSPRIYSKDIGTNLIDKGQPKIAAGRSPLSINTSDPLLTYNAAVYSSVLLAIPVIAVVNPKQTNSSTFSTSPTNPPVPNPEPSAIILGLIGLTGVWGSKKRRRLSSI